MKKVFSDIYKEKVWYKGSGSGSLPKTTRIYRKFIQEYIIKNKIKSVLDFGCGNWNFSKLINWRGINYLGLDVVDFVIEENRRKYTKKTIKFDVADLSNEKLPVADLIIVKDVIQHWSNKDILKIISKLKKFKHVLITNNCGRGDTNKDIKNGQARSLDLSKPPFNQKIKELLRYKSKRPHKNITDIKSVVTFI